MGGFRPLDGHWRLCWPILLGLGLCRAWFIGCSAFVRVSAGQTVLPSMLGYGCFVIGSCLCIVTAWLAPHLLDTMTSGKLMMLAVAAGVVGTTSLCLGATGSGTVYTVAGIAAIGASAGVLETVWTFSLVSRRSAAMYLDILGVMVVSSVFDLSLELLPVPLFLLLALTLIMASGVCFYVNEGHLRSERHVETSRNNGPASSHTQLGSQHVGGVRLLERIVVVSLAYCVVHIVAVPTGNIDIFGVSSLFVRSMTNLLVTMALAVLFILRRQTYAVMLFRLVLPVTVLGLIMQSFVAPGLGGVSFVILCAGNKMYDILSIILLSECILKFRLDVSQAFVFTGLLVSARSCGNLIGMALGRLADNSSVSFVTADGLVLAMILVTVICFFWLLSERTLFDRLNDESRIGVEGPHETIGPSAAVIDSLAEKCGLTSREHEVLALLARGKNRQAIMKELSISKGTAHAHISHVYQKTGTHSQQELISLVETASGS